MTSATPAAGRPAARSVPLDNRALDNRALDNRALANRALGAYGEQLAERHLVAQGLVVLDRNWRCDEGEIDLVLREDDVLVVCEVKTRSGVGFGTPHEAVSAAKLARLQRLAWRWAGAHAVDPPEVRVDLVAVIRPRRGASEVEHVRGVG
jgi:putative endonuclease